MILCRDYALHHNSLIINNDLLTTTILICFSNKIFLATGLPISYCVNLAPLAELLVITKLDAFSIHTI